MTGDGKTLLHFHILYSLLFLTLSCSAVNQLNRGESLIDGQTLISADDRFELGFFSPGTSTSRYLAIWYHDAQENDSVIWVANRDRPIPDRTGLLTFAADGNLIVTSGNGTNSPPIWSSNSTIVESNDTVAVLTATGNLILSRNETIGDVDRAFWQSFQNPTDTYLPNMRVLVDASAGENHAFRSWRSPNDPSFGNFTLGVDPRGAPQIVIWDELGERRWRSGQWNGLIFTGVPSMTTLTNFQRLYFTYNPSNSTALLRFRIRYDGMEEQLRWNEVSRNWDVMQRQPEDECERYNTCGEFGVCNESARDDPLKCDCIRGFMPKSEEEWNVGNWSRGCVRRTASVCSRNASSNGAGDGFLKMSGVNVPEVYEFMRVWDGSECSRQCTNNCSCTAYSYVEGIGCLLWWGEIVDLQRLEFAGRDLYVRVSRSDLSKLIDNRYSIFCIGKTENYSGSSTQRLNYMQKGNPDEQESFELPMFDLESIEFATNGFDISNLLGRGGFGPVYLGKLPDGKIVAIKRLSTSSGQGADEFKNEIMLISKLQHRNLVRLLGCCVDGLEKMLIYEFMPNKSLDTYLFDSTKKAELDWPIRMNIIHGIARGLLYLHRDSLLRIIHRDLKVSNILLDEKMNPKISDFGLARIFEGTQDLASTHKVVGTLGYMSPEYLLAGMFSDKSDVFSFGVLLLEIVSGRKTTSFHYEEQHSSLLAYAWRSWSETKGVDMVDESVAESSNPSEVSRCVNVGLLCVQDHATDRPTMAAVVSMLSGEMSLPRPNQPTFTFQNKTPNVNNFFPGGGQSSSAEKWSVNDITESVVEGR
ncbi:G-type lectin S-receptor-like serine/threonine-protein kinase B120 [Linum perenne]